MSKMNIAPHIRTACLKAGITDEQRMHNVQSGREAFNAPNNLRATFPPGR